MERKKKRNELKCSRLDVVPPFPGSKMGRKKENPLKMFHVFTCFCFLFCFGNSLLRIKKGMKANRRNSFRPQSLPELQGSRVVGGGCIETGMLQSSPYPRRNWAGG